MLQANCFVKVPAVVALYGGLSEGGDALRTAVDVAVRAQQNNDTAVELAWAAARILERVVTTVGRGWGRRVGDGLSHSLQVGNSRSVWLAWAAPGWAI